MTLSAREITPLAGSGNGEHAGEPVVVAVVGGFHSWRFEGARPGEGDMTFEGVIVAARARRGPWRRWAGAVSRRSHVKRHVLRAVLRGERTAPLSVECCAAGGRPGASWWWEWRVVG